MAEPGGDREFRPSVLHLGIHAGLHVQTSMAVGSSSGNGESKTSKLDIPLGRSRRSAIQTPGRFQTRFDMCKCPLTNGIQHDPETRQNFGFTDAAKSGRFQTRFDMCKCPLTNGIQHDPETRQNFGFTDAAKSLIVATHARSTFHSFYCKRLPEGILSCP